MTKSIAVAGKGGTGKTTLSSIIIRILVNAKKGSVLALDADPNSNLNELLGVKVENTIGGLREKFKKEAPRMQGGVYKDKMVEMDIHQSLIEGKSFDLLVMGRGEGPGCYCYANNLFKKYIDMLYDNYDFIVMDNEAGMEHLSRRTTNNVDYLLIISDPSPRGIMTASRIMNLVNEIEINAGERYLIVNRTNGKLDSLLEDQINKEGLKLLGIINNDLKIYDMDIKGNNIFNIPENSSSIIQVRELLEKIKVF